MDSYECGIYLPSDPSAAPKVYFFNPGGGHEGPKDAAGRSSRVANDQVTQTAVTTATAVPGATPAQAGIGAGIGAGIAGAVNDAMIEAHRVNTQFLFYQPDGKSLAKAISR